MPKPEKMSAGEVADELKHLRPGVSKHLGSEWTENLNNLIAALKDIEKFGETKRSPTLDENEEEEEKEEEEVDEDDFV